MKATPAGNFFAQRWSGQVPWQVLLWRDMLGVGTAINLGATLLALVAAIQGAPTGIVAALHFAPLPYNFFLLAAFWRLPQRPVLAAALAAAWFLAVLVI
jgi:hypothetical protein